MEVIIGFVQLAFNAEAIIVSVYPSFSFADLLLAIFGNQFCASKHAPNCPSKHFTIPPSSQQHHY